jgi:hypothetical protein
MRQFFWGLILVVVGCGPATLSKSDMKGDIERVRPVGWKLGPSEAYVFGLDSENHHEGKRSGVLFATDTRGENFGAMSQVIAADRYRGHRVRFSGYLKSNQVADWAGLWFRVDADGRRSIAFDNMEDRPITGTREWEPCEIVLEVPEEAAVMRIGLLLAGTGQVWIDECALEIVGDDVETTGIWTQGYESSQPIPMGLGTSPINMGFEKASTE